MILDFFILIFAYIACTNLCNYIINLGGNDIEDDGLQQGREMDAKLLGLTAKSSMEQIVSALFNKMKVGDYLPGDELIQINPKLAKPAALIKRIERVKEGIKVKLTMTAKIVLKATPYNIEDGAVFTFRILSVPKKPINPNGLILDLRSSQAEISGAPFKIYISEDTWSTNWSDWWQVYND